MSALSGAWLTDEQKAALKATADAMSAPGKGFLASDESAGPWLRAGHVEAKKIEDTARARRPNRSTHWVEAPAKRPAVPIGWKPAATHAHHPKNSRSPALGFRNTTSTGVERPRAALARVPLAPSRPSDPTFTPRGNSHNF